MISPRSHARLARIAAGLLRSYHYKVLLGARVARAHEVDFVPFGAVLRPTGYWVVLPHPSGRSRLWNASDSAARARALVGEVLAAARRC